MEPLHTSNKLYHTLKESRSWSRMLDVGTIGALNDAIASGRGEQIILLQEALMEERIGSLAAQIAAKKGIKFVMIAGRLLPERRHFPTACRFSFWQREENRIRSVWMIIMMTGSGVRGMQTEILILNVWRHWMSDSLMKI